MRRVLSFAARSAAVALGALAVTLAARAPAATADPAQIGDDPVLQRGAYLVNVGGCHDCHSPMRPGPAGPEHDPARLLSGHPETLVLPPPPPLDNAAWAWAGSGSNTAFAGPWGVSYAMNLTPDPDTGLGKWTEETFIGALRTGKHLGVSRPIMPPMPWMNYGRMSDDDLKAMFAYLRTVPAVRNRVPDWQPPAQ